MYAIEREKERETEPLKCDRQRYKVTGEDRDRKTVRKRGRETERQRDRETERQY